MRSSLIKLLFIPLLVAGSRLAVVAQSVSIGSTSYATITEALTSAQSGDVIEIRGIHTEPISVSKSVTLRGSDPVLDVIQAAASAGAATKRVVTLARETGATTAIDITIENLGIRYGSDPENGGGVQIDKLGGKAILKNLIIEGNATAKNGGGVSVAGTNADLVECVIRNNTAALDGGGIIVAPNNASGADQAVMISKSLVDSNTGRNGGGIYLNGNKGFGNNFKANVEVVNSTISNNQALSASSGIGGGAIWSKCAFWTGDNTTGNITLKMVHTTVYNNNHAADLKSGLTFTSDPAGALTNFSLYNSIVVAADTLVKKAINFNNSNTTAAVNNILGGTEAPPEFLADLTFNNSVGKKATFSGISGTLTVEEGGKVPLYALTEGAAAINFCVANAGVNLPTDDARNLTRDAIPDAGAFEVKATVNSAPVVSSTLSDLNLLVGFSTSSIDLASVFTDADGDMLVLSVSIADESVVTGTLDGASLTLNEAGLGTTTVTILADDEKGGTVETAFNVTVSEEEILGFEKQITMTIYPNPAQSFMLVQNLNDAPTGIQIMDLSGATYQVQADLSAKEIKVPVDHLAAGYYILRLSVNNQIISRKFLKN